MDKNLTNIQKWYSGRNVLVTGGTGFMGKVLLEKMLRCLPTLRKVYIIIRPKRGLSPDQRLEDIKKLPVFERLKEENPKALEKLVILEGNLSEENLGLSDKSVKILADEVSVVFHMAALLRLESEVRDAVLANTLGTKRVMELCQRMDKLMSIVHLSTAFCHCDLATLGEKVYPSEHNPYDIIQMVQTESDEVLLAKKEKLIHPHPNCYTFSKRLSEAVVKDYEETLPVAIARPSIVLPSLAEPMPGWVDSLNGPIGVLVASGKGVLRSMLCNGQYNAEVIPVDLAINGLIFTAYYRGLNNKSKEVFVVNLSAPRSEVDITWDEVVRRGRKVVHEYPFEWMLWYPDGTPRTNALLHWLIVILFQWFPAILLDGLFYLVGKERFMIRVQKKIMVGVEFLKYFTLNKWDFKTDRFLSIVDQHLIGEDRRLFCLVNIKYTIDNYLSTCILGARLYCLKESISTLKYTRIHLKILLVLHYTCIFLFWYFAIKIALTFLGCEDILQYDFWMHCKEWLRK